LDEQYNFFEPGSKYRVKQDCGDALSSFTEGDILVFKSWGFIPYDGAYAYEFYAGGVSVKSQVKTWVPFPEQLDNWKQFFEPVGGNETEKFKGVGSL